MFTITSIATDGTESCWAGARRTQESAERWMLIVWQRYGVPTAVKDENGVIVAATIDYPTDRL